MSANRMEQLEAFLQNSPQDPFLNYAIALEHLKLGNDEGALEKFFSLTENSPNYVGTYYHLGKLLEKVNREEEALEIYKKGMVVAERVGDGHSLSELKGVHQVLDEELNFDW